MASRKIFELFGSIVVEGLGTAKKEFTAFQKDLRATNKALNKMGRDAAKMGKTITKNITAPLAIAGGAVIKFGADFDQAMTNSIAIMGDVSDAMRNDMEMTARQVAKNLNMSVTSMGEAYFFLASAGLDAAESIAALPKVAAFAKAGNFDMAQATDLLTDSQSALGLASADTAEHIENMIMVSDQLIEANKNANASAEQFAEAITNKAGVALKDLNKDLSEGLAVLQVFADKGFAKGLKAGEKFDILLRDLQNAAVNNKEAFKSANVEIFDGNSKMKHMADITEILTNRFGDMSDEQKATELGMLGFTDTSVPVIKALLGTSDAIREYEESLKSAGGATDEVAQKQLQTFWQQLGLVQKRVIDLGLTLWKGLAPILMDVVLPAINAIIGAVESMVEWLGKHSNITAFIASFVGVIAVLGPVLLLFAKLIPAIKTAVAIYKTLVAVQTGLNVAMTANPIGLIVVGIAALIAAGVLLWKNWDTVKEKFVESWDFISFHFKNVATFIAKIYAKMILGILEGINKVGKFVPGLNKGLSLLIGTMKKGIAVLDAQTESRKALRKEQQAAKKLTEEENKIIADAKKLGDDLNKTTEETIKVKEKNTQKTLAQIEADKKALKAAEDLAKARKKAADEDFKISQQLAAAKSDLEDDVLTKLKMVTKQKLAQNEFEKSESLRIGAEKGLNLANITALYKAREDRIIKTSALSEVKIAESVKKQRISIAQKTLGAIQTVANGINSIWQAGLDRRIQELDMETEAKKVAIENSLLGEEEKALAIAAIDQEADAKKLELQKEDARRQKLASIMGIVLNTALAISAALTLPPPASFIMAGITAALGVAQLAIAVATPIPFAEGGLVRADPGTGIIAQIGEGKQDEMVVPMKTGAVELAKNIVGQMGGIGSDMISRASGNGGETHLHIGTLIADEFGLKKLSKILNKYTVAENQRTGATA